MIRNLGIIGAGHLAGFLAEGARRAGWDGRILIPNRPSAAAFSARFDAEILSGAQNVIDAADAVIVAVRPIQVDEALSGLVWPDGRTLISAMAGVKIARLGALAPGARVIRAMPISAATVGASPTPFFPHDAAAEAFLALLGPALLINDEAALEAASANAAVYGWVFRLIDRLVTANQRAGLDEDAAKKMAIGTLIAAGRVAADDDQDGEAILKTLATPGGITAQGLVVLEEADAFTPWAEAFGAVSARLKSD